MFISHLYLENFRNYDTEEIAFDKHKTILLGENAQGKTNIVEAILYFSTLNSIRTQANTDLINFNQTHASMKGHLETKITDYNLEIIFSRENRKICKINGVKKDKAEEFIGKLVTVSFSIDDMQLLRGNPADRRRWLDTAIAQIYPVYHTKQLQYQKIKNQRTAFLKSIRGILSKENLEMLSVWDEQLIISGSNITHIRQKYLAEIAQDAVRVHQEMSYGKEHLTIIYKSSINRTTPEPVPKVETIVEDFTATLHNMRQNELVRGQTLVGPHRDDIDFYINGQDAKFLGSQGQQRTVVISLKLAEIDFIKNVIHDTPILIMDDVMAELDTKRQQWLIDSIHEDIQVIMTTTHLNNFNAKWLDTTQILNVSKGHVFAEKVKI